MKTINMSKDLWIIILGTIVVILAALYGIQIDQLRMQKEIIVEQKQYMYTADRYITELENDFPDFLDTTSGSDAYCDYYEIYSPIH